MTYKIQINESLADAVYKGKKKLLIKHTDRGYQKGDLVKFIVVSGSEGLTPKPSKHPLMDMTFVIDYVLSGLGLQGRYAVFTIHSVEGEF
jgi:hypothetical protein